MLLRLFKSLFNNPATSGSSIQKQSLKEVYNLYQSNNLSAAESLLKDLLEREPMNADAWCLRAEIAAAFPDPDSAIKYYRQTIQLNPNICEAHGNLGLLLYDSGNFNEAAIFFERALQLNPADSQILNNAGINFLARGEYQEARKKIRQALEINPKLDTAWCNLGILAQYQLATKEALICFEKALALRPDSAETHCNYGLTLREVGRTDEALSHLQEALRIRPQYVDAHSNLAIILQDKSDLKRALYHVQEALRLKSDHIEAQCNLSIILKSMGEIKKAIQNLENVPDQNDPNVLMNKAYLFLLTGRFREGWQLHESRFKQEMYPRRCFSWPEWNGENIKDKNLLIYAEQGLGDEIMFANCFPDAISKASKVIIECEPRLKDLFARSFPEAIIVGRQRNAEDNWIQTLPKIDYQIGAGSLPKFFRNGLADFPQHNGYLKADSERILFWKERLEELGKGLKIGISWRGGLVKTGQISRSIDLADMLPIFNLPNISFINLQYTDCKDELVTFKTKTGISIHNWPEAISSYDETAALVSSLDLIITVCTAVVHLSGALGKPVWVMAPQVPEWRYGVYGKSMPWYPSSKVFRQTVRGNWSDVIEKIYKQLNEFKEKLCDY